MSVFSVNVMLSTISLKFTVCVTFLWVVGHGLRRTESNTTDTAILIHITNKESKYYDVSFKVACKVLGLVIQLS